MGLIPHVYVPARHQLLENALAVIDWGDIQGKGLSGSSFLTQIAAVESFLRYLNKQVRQDEEQESLVAAAQRIGPYEVLESSSDEVEKVRG